MKRYQVTEGDSGFNIWRRGWFFWECVRENCISLEYAKKWIATDKKEYQPAVVVWEE